MVQDLQEVDKHEVDTQDDDTLMAAPSQDTLEDTSVSEPLDDRVTILVVKSTGEESHFRVKRTTRLGKVQAVYADRLGTHVASIRFLYDGTRVEDHDTVASLDMADNGAAFAAVNA
ncbi:unnamed protein product [Peniophora sp. CBMAI 1063]|nr:unnamed protein product [Peniophora sp. CBMAI 1063]